MNGRKNSKVQNRALEDRSANFARNFFHVFNFIFLLAGFGVVGLGLWIRFKHDYAILLTNPTYPLTAYMLMAAGALTLFAALVGCISVLRQNRSWLLLYIFLLLFIFLMEAMVGLLAFIYMNQVENDLHRNLNSTFVENYGISARETDAIDQMQQEYKCCGASGFENYNESRWREETNTTNLVPDSCCKSVSPGCGRSYHPSNIPYTGCVHRLSEVIKQQLNIICGIGLGFSVIQIFGMVLSCFVYAKLS
ncbi:Tetraspanin family [Nesidiocoris tenuis]|uniref:Tetraspanin n=1 Tax=Nesidiocoris tenuis TaxID=355587 RepID=A0ABN7BCF2_9HEMI|nr:Tetraspanin family [Nesidiocoris tenuis]